MALCLLTGFASGMPLYFLINLIPAWLTDNAVDLKTIGLLSLVQMPYTWKFLWAPTLDHYAPPFSGRRRGWIILAQAGLAMSMLAFAALSLPLNLSLVIALCLAVALFSATQDIVIDAWRREFLREPEFGLGNAIHVNAYRLAGLVPGALGLLLADLLPWATVFAVMAAWIAVAMILTWLAPDGQSVAGSTPSGLSTGKRNGRTIFLAPFQEFFQRLGLRAALAILAFMVLYKLGDSMATALQTPFFMAMGYSKTQIGLIAKSSALWAVTTGGLVGGLWMLKLGINRALWLFGVVQALSILGFALLAYLPPAARNEWVLAGVMATEYFGVGLGTAAFTSFIARTASLGFAATQIAMLTALASVTRVFLSALTGYMVEAMGWTQFFLLCTALAVPGMALLLVVAPWHGPSKTES